MNYDEVVQGVRQRYGNAVPPVDPEQEKRIMQNRAMFPEAVAAVKRMHQQHENPHSVQKCPVCGGTSWADMGELIEGYHFVTACRCGEIKAAKSRIEKSGLSQAMQGMTFDSFRTDKPFRQQMARLCASYVQAYLNADPFKPMPWLFLGGQPGSGKTHLCTAVVKKLLDENVPCTYVSWPEKARELKALANDSGYRDAIEPLLKIPVLYIDDLFKSKGKTPPTDADVRLAFDIINSRYIQNRATIISSEWMIAEIIQQDEAPGSRLQERSQGYSINIAPDSEKIYGLNDN